MFRLGLILTICLFGFFIGQPSLGEGSQVYFAKYQDNGKGIRELLFQGWVPGNPDALGKPVLERLYPQTIVENQPLSGSNIVELRGRSARGIKVLLAQRNVLVVPADRADTNPVDEEVMTLVNSGSASNRIDLVFMGDGYTEAERDKFFADAQRLTDEMFKGKTFRSYLPIFNVHAVFRSSSQSGIGKNSQAKNTAYGLYRPGDTLRAIFVSKPQNARNSCRQAPGCDFPILMANDPHYGGLGGEFAITTSSPTSGTKVLRHELGHNFGSVGEEYDGNVFFGANYSSSVSSLKWLHWTEGTPKVEPLKARYIKWPWHHLANGPLRVQFTSDGRSAFYEVQYGASGIETDDTLEIRLDGQQIPASSPGHSDREFHAYFHEGGFSSGRHEIVFSEKVHDGNNWLSDLTIFEHGEGYNFDPEHVGAYPVFYASGSVAGYRATHETCLMRNMNSVIFCPICQENNWLQLLRSVSLIDAAEVKMLATSVQVNVHAPRLGQFRNDYRVEQQRLEITWRRNGTEVTELADKLSWELPKEEALGNWEVSVRFVTPEVRKDSSSLVARKEIRI